MDETTRMMWLRLFLRLLSVGFLAAFIPWITLILLNAPILAPGGTLARWSSWSDRSMHFTLASQSDVDADGSRPLACLFSDV